jgi:hypothetical protein
MNWLDITDEQNDFVNLAHVRTITVKGCGNRVVIKVVYSDDSDDLFMVAKARFSVLDYRLCDLVLT